MEVSNEEKINQFAATLNKNQLNDFESGLKKNGRNFVTITGPKKFYRFIGISDSGRKNDIYGCWWIDEGVFGDFTRGAKAINVSFNEFAKARLALPKSWNSMDNVYEMIIPDNVMVSAVTGIGRGQNFSISDFGHNVDSFKKLTEEEQRELNTIKNKVIFIGGDKQHFFNPEDIKQFKAYPIKIN